MLIAVFKILSIQLSIQPPQNKLTEAQHPSLASWIEQFLASVQTLPLAWTDTDLFPSCYQSLHRTQVTLLLSNGWGKQQVSTQPTTTISVLFLKEGAKETKCEHLTSNTRYSISVYPVIFYTPPASWSQSDRKRKTNTLHSKREISMHVCKDQLWTRCESLAI